jgi:predicted Rossmann-fold nucleotide-binding protein
MKKKRVETTAQWLKRFPGAQTLPFTIDRPALYRIPALYKGYARAKPDSWKNTFDRTVYEWTIDPKTSRPRQLKQQEVIAERLHDVAIGRGIDRFLSVAGKEPNNPAVGFMGGHDTNRDDPAFRQVASIARTLRQKGFTIVSGGGPGLMEAANFGAFMAPYSDTQFEQALQTLKDHPNASDNAAWVASACDVRERLLKKWNSKEKEESYSLGIPTWYYGNEPPNLFASHTGKYFFNSVREDGLVSIASGGIVFGPGKAGTVQEIFQDTPLNFYRPKGTRPTPMILLGVDYWDPPSPTKPAVGPVPNDPRKPVWPLLSALARQAGEPFQDALLLTDDAAEVAKFILDHHAQATTSWTARSERFKGRAVAAL